MTTTDRAPAVLVLGAYGLIGAGVVRRLRRGGCRVTGLGRSAATGRRVVPDLVWIVRDMAGLVTADDWLPLLDGIDTVVNAAGALQDGGGDDLDRLHHRAVAALAAACAGRGVGLVQISAVGARSDATTAFLRTKAAGDAAIRGPQPATAAGWRWCILRPGLVLAPTAFGGTALLRQLAAVPLIQPLAAPAAAIQTVGLADLAEAVAAAVAGRLPSGTDSDLVEAQPHSLRALTAAIRGWLGVAPARATVVMPDWLLPAVGWMADGLGRLGWRSPLRGTAIRVLTAGVRGDPAAWRQAVAAGAPAVAPLAETLARMPARAEDRLAARLSLLTAPAVAVLALFWAASGIIGILAPDAAAATLTAAGWSDAPARAAVLVGAAVDIGLAGLLLWRRTAPAACWGMVAVGLVYLAAATAIMPGLWLDPLGPLVKVVPGLMLAVIVRVLLDPR